MHFAIYADWRKKKVGILTSTIGTDRVLNGLISTFIIYVFSATG